MRISPGDIRLRYTGRIDRRNPERPEFIFPASSLGFRFWGKRAEIVLENRRVYWDNYVGAIVDGEQKKWKLEARGETRLVILEEDEEREHEVLFFKRQDSCHEFVIKGLELSEGSRLLEQPKRPGRRIEIYGDSVSAGEVSEAVAYVGQPDPEHNGEYSNSWYSYGWIAARRLGAELHSISQGGIPLLNGNGWVEPPVYPGMEFMWDKMHYHPMLGEPSAWDFSCYIPHVVIVAVGQNDSHPDDYMKTDPEGVRAAYWKYRYRCWLQELRGRYPGAVILLTTTIMEHSREWDEAIEAVCRELKDNRIRHFLYRKNGCGTPGHIRIPEAEQMAGELTDYINRLDIPVWED
ncbi:MAG: electron transporter RnfD [Lachnospiraceae bacterium]|nr:electron transporter RnfD [Lachnospiraceae bacterium]